jgi:hypothetical protein
VTPQSHFMVVAPIASGREASLRRLLGSMNRAPGVVDPLNEVLPFGRCERLHFARLVLLDATTTTPVYLVFMGDADGALQDVMASLAASAEAGLRQLFSHCAGFDARSDVLRWMLRHNEPVAASYVNWVGRTVPQIRQEAALQRALSAAVPRGHAAAVQTPLQLRRALLDFVAAETRAGRLTLTPPKATPLDWQITQLLHLIGVPLVGLLALPLLIVLLPLLLVQLRRLERSDPEICPRPGPDALQALRQLEDHDVTNQFTALGPVKPGRFRRGLVIVVLVLIDYACRHVFTRGHLARVQTIHFARWVFLDDKRRVLFASNYDGSHEAYMDDFINKVAWGLNLVFSNGVGWPHTDWLILRGARREQRFKSYQRSHQLPTQVWYKAYPGLTLVDLQHNQRIRAGLEQAEMSEAQALDWLKLL